MGFGCGAEEKRTKKKINSNISEEKIINMNKKSSEFNILDKALNEHNKYRSYHNCKPLSLNNELCELAQKYAKECAKAKNIIHFNDLYNGDIIGQNISVIDIDYFDVKEICKKWYYEKNNYKFYSNKYIEGTGHFTQLIWKETKLVGFGYKEDNNGKLYFVANYYPAGNIFSEFEKNVPFLLNQ